MPWSRYVLRRGPQSDAKLQMISKFLFVSAIKSHFAYMSDKTWFLFRFQDYLLGLRTVRNRCVPKDFLLISNTFKSMRKEACQILRTYVCQKSLKRVILKIDQKKVSATNSHGHKSQIWLTKNLVWMCITSFMYIQ